MEFLERIPFEPDDFGRRKVKQKLNELLNLYGLTPKDLENQDTYIRYVEPLLSRLEEQGFTVDSLELVEIITELEDESSDDEGEGGLGTREPRRPLPNSGEGSIELPEPGDLDTSTAL